MRSIKQKKMEAEGQPDSDNLFLNSLTQPEYVLFVETRKNQDRWDKTGLHSDILQEKIIRYEEELSQDDSGADEFSVEELREQFKVFRDPTY